MRKYIAVFSWQFLFWLVGNGNPLSKSQYKHPYPTPSADIASCASPHLDTRLPGKWEYPDKQQNQRFFNDHVHRTGYIYILVDGRNSQRVSLPR